MKHPRGGGHFYVQHQVERPPRLSPSSPKTYALCTKSCVHGTRTSTDSAFPTRTPHPLPARPPFDLPVSRWRHAEGCAATAHAYHSRAGDRWVCSEEATRAWLKWRCALAGFLASSPEALNAVRDGAYARLDWTGPHERAAGCG